MAIEKINSVIEVYMRSKGAIRPHMFISGPSGSGKTFTVEAAAERHGVKVYSVNSAQITNEGLSGNALSKSLVGLKEYQASPLIVFFDEFDKVLERGASLTAGNVQNEVLKMLEDTETEVIGNYGHYDRVDVSHVLFFFAGTFGGAHIEHGSELVEKGMRPELYGRVPIHVHIEKPSLDAILRGIRSSDLLRDYARFNDRASYEDALKIISDRATEVYDKNMIGMRLINSLIHQFFIEGGFQDPPKKRGFGFHVSSPTLDVQATA